MRLSPLFRGLALASHLALLAWLLLRAAGPAGYALAAPLLLPLPGLIAGRSYTHAWASMLLAFYVALFLSEGYAEPARKWQHFGLASLAALDFVSLMLFVRLGARERQALQAASAPASRTAASDDAGR